MKYLVIGLLMFGCGKKTQTKQQIVEVAPKPGLKCEIYDLTGTTPSQLPNYTNLPVLDTIYVSSLNNANSNNTSIMSIFQGTGHESLVEQFGLSCTGKLKVQSGSYKFYLTSDDGAKLYVNNILVINHDGQHSSSKKTGTISLSNGVVDIKVKYFNNLGSKSLILSMKVPGSSIEEIIKF